MLCLDSFENQRICKRGTVHSYARCVVFRRLVSDIERGLCRCACIAFRRFHSGVFCLPVKLPECNAALQCLKRIPIGLTVYGLVLPFLLILLFGCFVSVPVWPLTLTLPIGFLFG